MTHGGSRFIGLTHARGSGHEIAPLSLRTRRRRRGIPVLLVTLATLLVAVPVALSASEPKPGQRIDLKVLVLTTPTLDPVAAAWESALDREGVPHDRKIVSGSVGLTDADLADYSANRAKYQAVIVAPGDTAMTQATKDALAKLETTFGVRRLSDNILDPTLHGLNPPIFAEQDGNSGTLTVTGRAAFPYLVGPVPIEGPAWGFQATPGAGFTTLVGGPGGSAYLGINNLPDGRQEMVNAVPGNASQSHHQLLRHGIINWLTRGVFLGHQRDYFAMQADDIFLPDDRWDMERNLTGVDGTTTASDEYQCDHVIDGVNDCKPIRMTAADVTRLINWQNTNGIKLDMVFNGDGSEEAIAAAGGAPDPLTDAFLANKSQFHWTNHTWSHLQLDALSQAQIQNEIAQNIQWAQQKGLPFDPTELVTGEHSGLHNPAMPAAISQTGIRWIAADNSREPTPYAVGQATTVPRYPSNVYYNVGTMAEQLDEYNYIYLPPTLGGKCVNSPTNTCLTAPATWQQYVDSEANIMFDHVMGNDPKPHYAHQSNLAEDAVLYPVLEAVLARYRPYFSTPMVQLTHAQIGQEMQRQRAWKDAGAGVSAYVQDGQVHVVNTTGSAIDVPLTGTSVGSLYGGQWSGWTNVPASSERVFEPSDPANTAVPTVTGSVAAVGGTLTATSGTWSGTPTIGLSLQWQRCNIAGAACESIPGATTATYTTQDADKDKRLRVVVSAANWISSYSQARSAVTDVVAPTPQPPDPDPNPNPNPNPNPPTTGGGATTPPPTGGPAGPAPRLSLKALRISPKRFGLTGASRSAWLSWRVSDRATLRLTFRRSRPGRRVAGACRAPSKGNLARPACDRLVTVVTVNRRVSAGAGGLKLTGKVGGRRLPAGSYRLVVTAMSVDPSRRPSTRRTLGFAVLKELR